MWYKTLFALVFVTYIYRSLVARQREGPLSHTHTSFRILVAILLNNKHPTFQLDLILEKFVGFCYMTLSS